MIKKIGRNEKCPCGSGIKFKYCCGKYNAIDTRKLDFYKIMTDNNIDKKVSEAIYYLLEYVEQKPWLGAYHAVSSILYIFLSEHGYKPELCIGEVDAHLEKPFDHSWILLNNKFLDITIHIGLNGNGYKSPIIMDQILINSNQHDVSYGIDFMGLSTEANAVFNTELTEYMDNFPNYGDGLWYFVEKLFKITENYYDKYLLKAKYFGSKRSIYILE